MIKDLKVFSRTQARIKSHSMKTVCSLFPNTFMNLLISVRPNNVRRQIVIHMSLDQSHALLGALLVFKLNEQVVMRGCFTLDIVANLDTDVTSQASLV